MEFVFGIHAVDSLLRRQPGAVERLWLQAGRKDQRLAGLEALAQNQGVAVSRVAKKELDERVSGRHQGVVAQTGGQPSETGADNLWSEAQLLALADDADGPLLLLVLDGVTDPHNLGACLRSADAAGVHAVVVPKDRAAGLTPTVRKVACGAAETVPFVQVSNLSRTLKALKARGLWLFGAAGEAEKSLYDNDLTGSVALVMGAEERGLRRLTRELCDVLVNLPMSGSVSSLNVSVATGICLFEVVRQRAADPADGR